MPLPTFHAVTMMVQFLEMGFPCLSIIYMIYRTVEAKALKTVDQTDVIEFIKDVETSIYLN